MAGSTPESILLIDDDKLLLAMMADIVTEAGFKPLTAGSAEEGRTRLVEGPRAAFVDFTMPGDSGDLFCRDVRLSGSAWDMPLVMVTGREESDIIRRCLVSGADDFILKPVQKHEVLSKLNAVKGGGEPGFQRKLTTKRVLLATRHPFFRENVLRVLKASGCEVELVIDERSLAPAPGKPRPDVAIVDLDLVGPEAVEALRAPDPATGTAPGLICMASGATMRSRGMRWGAAAEKLWNLLSPFDADEERDEVLRHVSRSLLVGGRGPTSRRKARAPFDSAVRFRWADEPHWTNGIGFDVSENGMFIRTLAPLRPARRVVEMVFRVGKVENISVKGAVVWANGYGPRHIATLPFGMGVSFTEISDDHIAQLRAYVGRRLDAPSKPPSPP
jgi:CheY-like chemotaxis protein